MIYLAGHTDFPEIHYNGKDIINIYCGAHLVWEKINSCYGKGFWVNALPWRNDIGWKNNV